jgi:WD40 repeat protein
MRATRDGRVYFVDNNSRTTTWKDPRSTTKFQTLQGHKGEVLCMAISSNGQQIATGGEDQKIRIWDADSGSLVGDPLNLPNSSSVTSVSFSLDDLLMVIGSSDGVVQVCDTKLNKSIIKSLGHTLAVRSAMFSPSGSLIASVSDDKTCRLWDPRTGDMVTEPLRGHTKAVRLVCFSADSTRLATGSSDRTIRVWDVQSGALICKPLGDLQNSPRMLAFTNDGKRIVGGSKERQFCIWSAESGALLSGPTALIGRSVLASLFRPDCHGLTASPNGLWLATGNLNFIVVRMARATDFQIWDPDTGKRVITDRVGRGGFIKCLVFSPDGKRLFIGDSDSNIEVYALT